MPTKIPLITTADQLLAASDELGPCELARGELIMMTPAGDEHSRIEATVFLTIGNYVQAQRLGLTYTGDAGFLLEEDPDTVRAPDVAFVRASRVSLRPHRGFFPGPPDLAVEIRSPDDRPEEIAAKIEEYLRMGVQVVWDVDPEKRTVVVHQSESEPRTYSENDTLTEPILLPGFEMPVKSMFQW